MHLKRGSCNPLTQLPVISEPCGLHINGYKEEKERYPQRGGRTEVSDLSRVLTSSFFFLSLTFIVHYDRIREIGLFLCCE